MTASLNRWFEKDFVYTRGRNAGRRLDRCADVRRASRSGARFWAFGYRLQLMDDGWLLY